MSKARAINAVVFTLIQFAAWAAVFYVWAVVVEDASTQSLFLGAVFPGMVPTFIGMLRDDRLREKEDKMSRYSNAWEED